jgi:hypothetical protein
VTGLPRTARQARAPEPAAHSRAPALPGQILALASVLPAVLAAAWVAGALPLLALHIYTPVPGTLLALVLAAVLARPAIRVALAAADRFGEVPWWVLIGVLVVVVVAGVLAYAHSAEDVLVRRDPGSYSMSATWLSSHGTILMPAHTQLFGAQNDNLVLASQGFYQQGSHIIPQFMTGVPVLLAIGGWMFGLTGVLHANAIIGSLALLAFAGLAVRLVDAKWAPLAVLALAFVQPELDVMRATYSEPAAQLILLGGLAIVLDAFAAGDLIPGFWPRAETPVAALSAPESGRPATPRAATDPETAAWGLGVGGLVLGLVFVVRIDAVADLFPLVPLFGWLAYHRITGWLRFAGGLLLGLAFGGFDCLVLTYPYTEHVGSDLKAVGYGFAVLVPLTFAFFVVARRRQLRESGGATPRQRRGMLVALVIAIVLNVISVGLAYLLLPVARALRRFLPALAAAGAFLIGLFFFLRPHLMTMRANPASGGANYVMQVQRFLHMPVDPTRSYYEDATRWLSWYLGWGTLALALGGACWLAYEQIAGRRRVWAPAFLVFFGTASAVLLRPSITPDHPWADRRFVPVVLPGLVLFAIAVVPPITRWVASRAPGLIPQALIGLAVVIVVVVPVWVGTRAVVYSKTEVGEPTLVHEVCAQLRPNDVVLAIGGRARTEWPGTLKVMCGVNVGYLLDNIDTPQMDDIAARVTADGGRLMLLAESTADKNNAFAQAAWPDKPTGSLITSEATHTLVTRPGKPTEFLTEMWLGEYQPSGS